MTADRLARIAVYNRVREECRQLAAGASAGARRVMLFHIVGTWDRIVQDAEAEPLHNAS